MKGKKLWSRLLFLVMLALLFVLLINPRLIPFLSQQTQEQVSSAVQATFNSTMADGEAAFTLPKLFNMLAAIILVLLVSGIIRMIVDVATLRGKRSRTVAGLILSVVRYASVIIIIVWCLSIMGVNIAAIFAGVGVLSLALAFGAQSLLEDIITGIFIIFESQYNVGDIIVLDDFRGVVRNIGVRTTSIEDAGGNVKIVNNSDIRNLQNRSANPSLAICDVGVSYNHRVEQVEAVLKKGLPRIGAMYPDLFLENPRYLGVQELGDSAVVMRVCVLVREEDVFIAQRAVNRELKILFDDNGIEIPFMQVVLHNGDALTEGVSGEAAEKK